MGSSGSFPTDSFQLLPPLVQEPNLFRSWVCFGGGGYPSRAAEKIDSSRKVLPSPDLPHGSVSQELLEVPYFSSQSLDPSIASSAVGVFKCRLDSGRLLCSRSSQLLLCRSHRRSICLKQDSTRQTGRPFRRFSRPRLLLFDNAARQGQHLCRWPSRECPRLGYATFLRRTLSRASRVSSEPAVSSAVNPTRTTHSHLIQIVSNPYLPNYINERS